MTARMTAETTRTNHPPVRSTTATNRACSSAPTPRPVSTVFHRHASVTACISAAIGRTRSTVRPTRVWTVSSSVTTPRSVSLSHIAATAASTVPTSRTNAAVVSIPLGLSPSSKLKRHGPFVAFNIYCKIMLYGINYTYYSVKPVKISFRVPFRG